MPSFAGRVFKSFFATRVSRTRANVPVEIRRSLSIETICPTSFGANSTASDEFPHVNISLDISRMQKERE